jgi:hypothetical protein
MNPAGLFNLSVTLRTATNTVAADGSYSTGFTTTTIPCAINPLSSSEAIQYERKASGEFARMYCGPAVSITPTSEIEWSSNIWRVAGRPRNTGGRGVFLTVDLERIK